MKDQLDPHPAVTITGLLDCEDVARLLRTTPKQIHHMIARGQILAPIRVRGLTLRWSARALQEWLALATDGQLPVAPVAPAADGRAQEKRPRGRPSKGST